MIDWLKDNRNAVFLLCSTLILLGLVSGAAGCSLQDLIKFDVPVAVQEVTDVPERVSLNSAPHVWEEWQKHIDSASNQLAIAIGEANERYEILSNLTNMGVEALSVQAGQFPGGALLVTGLSMLTGLFLKKPGTDRIIASEKEDSYNAGIDQGRRVAVQLMSAKEEADVDTEGE